MSNGGGLSTVLACSTDRFAAIAPVAGANLAAGCQPSAPVGISAVHGDADIVVAYDSPIATVPDAVAAFAVAAGCADEPVVSQPFPDIEVTAWEGCGQTTVELTTVLGGGHTWPGRDLVDEIGAEGIAAVAGARGMTSEQLLAILGGMTTNVDPTQRALDHFDRVRSAVAGS